MNIILAILIQDSQIIRLTGHREHYTDAKYYITQAKFLGDSPVPLVYHLFHIILLLLIYLIHIHKSHFC